MGHKVPLDQQEIKYESSLVSSPKDMPCLNFNINVLHNSSSYG